MDGITLDELQARRAVLAKEREEHAKEARDRDLGFAYAMGEIEQLIKLAEARREATE